MSTIASEVRMEIRWIAIVSGDTPTADYQPTPSSGVSDALVKEVVDISLKLHPHNDSARFPKDRDVYAFFKSASTQDYVVMRVIPVTTGSRLALRYYCLILSRSDFAALQNAPFQTRELRLHDKVREQQARGDYEPIVVTIPPAATQMQTRSLTAVDGSKFASGARFLPTDANIQEFEDYCDTLKTSAKVPPTFTTWWAGGLTVPAQYFDVAFQASVSKIMSLPVALENARELELQVKKCLLSLSDSDGQSGRVMAEIQRKVSAVSGGHQRRGKQHTESGGLSVFPVHRDRKVRRCRHRSGIADQQPFGRYALEKRSGRFGTAVQKTGDRPGGNQAAAQCVQQQRERRCDLSVRCFLRRGGQQKKFRDAQNGGRSGRRGRAAGRRPDDVQQEARFQPGRWNRQNETCAGSKITGQSSECAKDGGVRRTGAGQCPLRRSLRSAFRVGVR